MEIRVTLSPCNQRLANRHVTEQHRIATKIRWINSLSLQPKWRDPYSEII